VKDPVDVEPEAFDAASKVFGDKIYTQLLDAGTGLGGWAGRLWGDGGE
jgi:hypothetical protein